MSAMIPFNSNNRIRVDVPRVLNRVVDALEASQPQTRGELMLSTGGTEMELNVVLDRAMTDGQVERKIIAGRISYHLADWEPSAPARSKPSPLPSLKEVLPPPEAPTVVAVDLQPTPVSAPEPILVPEEVAEPVAEAPVTAPSAATPAVQLDQRATAQSALLDALTRTDKPALMNELAAAAGLSLVAAKSALQELRLKGLVAVQGRSRASRWFMAGTQPNHPPGVTTPAAQAIDAEVSTPAPAVPDLSATVTVPAGPRDGLSFPGELHFEPATDELLAWHAAAAERESARRQTKRPALPFGDLNDLFELPEAMRNTGEPAAKRVNAARYALWSDGRLEIDAGDQHWHLSQSATRSLFDYLDRVCAIAP